MTEPVDWAVIDDALFDWIIGALGLENDQCLWAKQNAPQPRYPYVTLDHPGFADEPGTLDETRTSTDLGQPAGEEIELLTTGPREFTLTVTAHVDDRTGGAHDANANAEALLSKAHSSLGKQSVLDALAAAGIALIERMAVLDTSVVVNGEWVSQASMDVRLRVTSNVTERTGYIDKVAVSSTFSGAQASLNLADYLIDAS